jgi:hypothetical protein
MSDPVKIDPADFWRLKAKGEETRRVKLEAMAEAQARIAAAMKAQQAVFDELAEKYGLDRSQGYGFDETTCALVATTDGRMAS